MTDKAVWIKESDHSISILEHVFVYLERFGSAIRVIDFNIGPQSKLTHE